jgi:hypothetical protein
VQERQRPLKYPSGFVGLHELTLYSNFVKKKDEPFVLRILNVISNVASQIYYPTEHIAFLADNKILNIKSAKFWLISIVCWLVSSLADFLRFSQFDIFVSMHKENTFLS